MKTIPVLNPKAEDYQQALKSMGTFIDVTVEDLMTLTAKAEQYARQRRVEETLIENIMTSPVETVYQHTSLNEAAHKLVSHRISGLPVLDQDNSLAGIITEADFLRILGVPAPLPHQSLWHTLESVFSRITEAEHLETPDDTVSTHMTRHVVTAHPDDKVKKVLDLMKQHQVKRVVVTDSDGQVCGIVTRSNLVRLFFDSFLNQEAGGNNNG